MKNKLLEIITRHLAPPARLAAFLLAAFAVGGAWAATLSYSGYISTDSANPTTVFSGVSLSDIGSTYVLKGNMGGANIAAPGEAGVYNASLDSGVLTVQFQKIDGTSGGTWAKCVVVKLQQSGDDITAYASATAYNSTLVLGRDFSSASGTPVSSASAAGYGIYDLSLVAGRKLEYKTTWSNKSTGNAAQPFWRLKIPTSSTLDQDTLVKISDVKIGSRASSWSTSYDSAYMCVIDQNDDRIYSTELTGYAANLRLASSASETVPALVYSFPDSTPVMVEAGDTYNVEFLQSDKTYTSDKKNPGGAKVVNFAAANDSCAVNMATYFEKNTYYPVSEVEVLVVSTATAATGDWRAQTWTNGAADWTAAGATPVLLTVTDDCTVNVDSAVSVESIIFDVAEGKTLTLAGSNSLTAANGIIIKGGTVSVSAANLVGTVYGDGELKFVGIRPTTTATNPSLVLTDSAWEGTVTIQYDYANTATGGNRQLFPQAWGSANSKIKWNGVAGYFGGCTSAAGWILEDLTVNDTTYPALRKNDGSSSSMTTAPSLSGSGTFADESNPSERFKFADGSSFAGSINITSSSGNGMNVQFGATAVAKVARTIHVLSGATVNVAANKTWAAPGGMVVAGTLNVASGATVPTITTTGTAAYVFSSSATIGTVAGSSIGSSLSIMSGTVSVTDPAITSLTIPAETGSTYMNLGTLDLSGCTSLTALYLNLGASKTVEMTNITLPSGCTVYANAGSVRDLSNYSVSGAIYLVEETKAEYGAGSLTVENVPTGASVAVRRVDGTIVSATVDGTTATLTGAVKIDGAATAYDVTFNGTTTLAYETKPARINCNSGYSAAYNNDANDKTTGIMLKCNPWLANDTSRTGTTGGQYVLDDIPNMQSAMTIAVVGQMSSYANTIFLHFGHNNGDSNTGLLICRTSNPDEVLVAYNTGATVTELTTMTVPNASAARHAYVITKEDAASTTTFTIYLDGTKWKTVVLNSVLTMPQGGVQVGSDFGGQFNHNTYKKSTEADDTGYVNCIRLYDRILTQAEINQYSDPSEYPYVSPHGSSARTFDTANEDWVEDGASDWANTYEETTTKAAAPRAGSALTVKTSVATTISANLESTVSYDSLTVNGTGATFAKVNGYGGVISVAGSSVIGAPVTINAGALVLGGPVTITEGGSVTFNYSDYEVASADVIQLTGEMEEAESGKITINPPADQHYTYTYGYSGTQYVITPAVAVAVLNHEGTLTGYTTAEAAFDDAVSGDTVTLQTAYLTPGTHATYTGDKTGVNVVVRGYTIAPAVADGTTTWSTSSYIWTGAGADNNWTTPANWGLASGYPGSSVNNNNVYTSDAVVFGKNATVTVSSTVYTASITLEDGAVVTFTGDGAIKTAYYNNSGSFQLLGSGEVHMNGITFYVPYATSWKDDGSIQVPLVVDSGANKIYIGGNDNRYGQLNITSTGSLQGSGSIEFEAAYISSSRIYINGDTSSFSGTATFNAQIFDLPVGGSGTWVLGSDDVANAISSISFSGGVLSLPDDVTVDVSAKIAAGTHTAAVKVNDATGSREWNAGAVNGSYGFVKNGAGTLTLAQTPAYTGDTVVNAGVLVLPVGTAFSGAVTIAEGAAIQFAGDATWADGSEQTLCTFTTAPDADTLSRIEITGFGGRQSATLNYDSGTGEYVATVTSPTLVWNGADGANWGDTGVWLVDGEATTYMSGDKVSFPDSLFTGDTTELTVNVGADVDPSLVTIAPGTGHTYKFTGTGKVTTADLVVAATGAGTVTLAADVFSGLAIANAGTVEVDESGSGVSIGAVTGSGKIKATSGALHTTGTISSTTSMSIAQGATVYVEAKPGDFRTASGALVITGSGKLVVCNGATLVTAKDSSLNGFAGELRIESGGQVNTPNGSRDRVTGSGKLTLAGGTLNGSSGGSVIIADTTLANSSLELEDGTTSSVTVSNVRLIYGGPITGGGTLNATGKAFSLQSSASSDFTGAVNFGTASNPVQHGIYSVGAGSENADYSFTGTNVDGVGGVISVSGTTAEAPVKLGSLAIASGTTVQNVNAGTYVEVGKNDNSTLEGTISGQTMTLTKVGANSTLTLGSGFSAVSGSTLNVDAGSLSTGALTYSGLNLAIGEDASYTATGDVVLDGTTLDVDGFATFGTASAPAWLKAQNNAVINLNAGGELAICRITAYGDYTVNFDGGTLTEYDGNGAGKENIIGGRNTDWEHEDNYTITLNVKAGGLTVDTATATTITPVLAGDAESAGGGLTKKGVGTLTLADDPTFTGAITVEAGSVVLPTGDYTLGANTIVSARGDGTMTLAYATTVELTVPSVANTTVEVTAGGETLTGNNGVYTVPVGVEVTVTYTGTNGNVVTAGGTITGTYNEAAAVDTTGVTVASAAVWTGNGAGNGWTTAGNWSTGSVPDENTPVEFPNLGSAYTVWIGTGSKCGTLQVDGDVTFAQWDDSVTDNKSLELHGNVTGSGTLTLGRAGLWNNTGSTITVAQTLDLVIADVRNGENALVDSWLSGSAIQVDGDVDIQGRMYTWDNAHVFNGAVTVQWFTANGARVVFNGDITLKDGSYFDNYSGLGWEFNGITVTALGNTGALFYNGAEVGASVTGTGVTFAGRNKFNTAGEAVPVISAPAVLKSGATVSMMNNGTITTYSAETVNHAVEVSADGSYKVYTCVIPQANAPAIDMTESSPVTVTTSGVTFAVAADSLIEGLYYRVKAVDGEGNESAAASTVKVKYTGDNASALNFTAPLPTDGVLYYTIEASDSAE